MYPREKKMENVREDILADEPAQGPTGTTEANVAVEPTPTSDTSLQVMEIDMSGSPDDIAKDEADALAQGLRVFRKDANGAVIEDKEFSKKKAEAVIPTETEEEHPLAKRLFGDKQEVATSQEKAPAPVKEWFSKIGIADPDALIAEVPKLRTQYAEAKKELDIKTADLSYLAKLSTEAKNIIQHEIDGKPWKHIVARPEVDYSVAFKKQDPLAMLESYAKGKVTQEQFEEYKDRDGDPQTKAYVEAVLEKAELLYERDADDSNNYISRRTEEVNAIHQAQEQSLKDAMENLVITVPGAKNHANRIQGLITPDKILGLFFNADGTVKLSAPEDVWLLTDRDAILGSKQARMKADVEHRTTVDALRRTSERPITQARRSPNTSTGGKDEGYKKAQALVDGLFG